MLKNKLFNPLGDKDPSKRRIINGNSTNLFELNNIKFDWSTKIYRAMMNNFWIPEEIPLGADQKGYKVLSDSEKSAFDKVISFLVFLDSLQTNNIPNISNYITAPEVNLCLIIHAYQEAIHSQSYGYILDTVVTPSKRDKIYNIWRDDPILKKRIEIITNIYEKFLSEPSDNNFVDVLFANYILEGLYFYSGFLFFYTLSKQGKMNGTTQVIRYIQRDEIVHLVLFKNIISAVKNENKHLFTPEKTEEIRELFKVSSQNEIEWGKYVIKDGILGLSDAQIQKYIEYLTDYRMKNVGIEPIYNTHTTNPIPWVDTFSSVNSIKSDFFETKPTSYSQTSENMDWDDDNIDFDL